MTTPDEAQALLPVTPDRDLAQFFFEMGFGACYAEAIVRNGNKVPFPLTDVEIERQWAISREAYDDADELEAMLSLARHRISHSLPGDVGTGADAQRNIVRAVIDCYNTARPAGLSPVEYVHSKRLVRDAFAALSNVPVQIEQEELLDLIDDAISDSFDEEWNSRMGARHIVGALEHEGWAVVPLAALTPSPCPGDVGTDHRIDMANVGEALMEAIRDYSGHSFIEHWHPADCPSEIVGDLLNALDEADGWKLVAGLPMWWAGIVTDGEHVAFAQKAEADFDGYYWAVDPEDALEWEPTHCIAAPGDAAAALTPSALSGDAGEGETTTKENNDA